MEIVRKRSHAIGWLMSASMILFLSSNFVNAGNLAFNLVFSRWMGPALFSDLAFLLTLKLSILGVLNALQFLVTEKTAEASRRQLVQNVQAYRRLNRIVTLVIFLMLPLLITATLYFGFAETLGLQDEYSLLVFYFGIPFYLPLVIWRGVAQGEVDLWRMVTSANAEMIVRFGLGALFFWLGLGISSVILAFVLSLFAAWWFALPQFPNYKLPARKLKEALPWKQSLPWAAIQLGTVLALDGDVFVAKLIMSSTDAGYVAAISLVQRIIFFASFSLAAILLPQVIHEVKNGGRGFNKAVPIIGLILLTIIPILIVLKVMPDLATKVLFGSEFLQISQWLFRAGLSASMITLSYFITIFLMAHGKKSIGALFLGATVLQLVTMGIALKYYEPSLEILVNTKLYFQFATLATVFFIAFFTLQSQVSHTERTLS